MSKEYDDYLNQHIFNVSKGFQWIITNINENTLLDIFPSLHIGQCSYQINHHDASKFGGEYQPYDDYFYGNKNDPNVIKDFEYAWLHHIHQNPHHWQHWVLIFDDTENDKPYKALDMDDCDIIEMICDWWSFSWKEYEGERGVVGLYEIFNWYDMHKDVMILSEATREKVEKFLSVLKKALEENEVYLY